MNYIGIGLLVAMVGLIGLLCLICYAAAMELEPDRKVAITPLVIIAAMATWIYLTVF